MPCAILPYIIKSAITIISIIAFSSLSNLLIIYNSKLISYIATKLFIKRLANFLLIKTKLLTLISLNASNIKDPKLVTII